MIQTITRPDATRPDSMNLMDSPQNIRKAIRERTPPTRAGVSVLMNTYNSMPYLPAAVESILRQTYDDFQFVIVDDGSTDSSPEYLRSLRDDRICLITQPNRGTSTAANNGILHCERRYIARLDADDYSPPDRLEKQVAHMEAHPDLVMLGSTFRYFGDRRIGPIIKLPIHHDQIRAHLLRGYHAVVHGAIMLRSNAVLRNGGYWEHPFFEDWDFYLRMTEAGRVANLHDVVYHYRALATSISGNRMAEMRLHYDYAIDAAARRSKGEAAIDLDAFKAKRGKQTWWRQKINHYENLAMSSYRRALGECYGDAVIKGRLRLLAAASLSPGRTIRRLIRGTAVNP